VNTQQSIYLSLLDRIPAADVPLWDQRPLLYRLVKRAFDLLLGVPILIISLPLLTATATYIIGTDPS